MLNFLNSYIACTHITVIEYHKSLNYSKKILHYFIKMPEA